MFSITSSQLSLIMPTATPELVAKYCEPLNTMMALSEINTPLRVAHFLAQCGEETGDMHAVEENLNYSTARLMQVWPHLYSRADLVAAYAHQPVKIANRSYGNRMGNGNEESGDGWKFRGRGFIQLTGHDNYLAYAKARNCVQLVMSNPDVIVSDPDRTVDTACFYWHKAGCNALSDTDDIVAVTKRVNGGLLNLDKRQAHLTAAKKAFGL